MNNNKKKNPKKHTATQTPAEMGSQSLSSSALPLPPPHPDCAADIVLLTEGEKERWGDFHEDAHREAKLETESEQFSDCQSGSLSTTEPSLLDKHTEKDEEESKPCWNVPHHRGKKKKNGGLVSKEVWQWQLGLC